jgi:hypothetical protein
VIETPHKPEVEDAPAPAPALCGCGHPLQRHDAIAARFCEATVAGALTRGCICKP